MATVDDLCYVTVLNLAPILDVRESRFITSLSWASRRHGVWFSVYSRRTSFVWCVKRIADNNNSNALVFTLEREFGATNDDLIFNCGKGRLM